jgi:hypothetical protein
MRGFGTRKTAAREVRRWLTEWRVRSVRTTVSMAAGGGEWPGVAVAAVVVAAAAVAAAAAAVVVGLGVLSVRASRWSAAKTAPYAASSTCNKLVCDHGGSITEDRSRRIDHGAFAEHRPRRFRSQVRSPIAHLCAEKRHERTDATSKKEREGGGEGGERGVVHAVEAQHEASALGAAPIERGREGRFGGLQVEQARGARQRGTRHLPTSGRDRRTLSARGQHHIRSCRVRATAWIRAR